MKSLVVILFLLIQSSFVFAQQLSHISSIDDDNTPPPYVDVFAETLPPELYDQMIREAEELNLAPITNTRATELFNGLKSDPKARMRYPDGLCTRRRIHIKSVLNAKRVTNGRLYINCPAKNGRLRLHDQVSGRYFTFSNFHDTNVVLVSTGSGNTYKVMDLQFQSGPVALSTYLRRSERIKDFCQRLL